MLMLVLVLVGVWQSVNVKPMQSKEQKRGKAVPLERGSYDEQGKSI